MSFADAVAGPDTLPAGSVRVAVTASPLVRAGDSGTENVPSAPTVAVPITPPPGPRIVTVAPGSPAPVTEAPSSDTSRFVGADGAVRSGAVAVAGPETLPLASDRTTVTCSLLIRGGLKVMAKVPSAPTTPAPIWLPAALRTMTVVPTSPDPVSRPPVASN